MQTCIPKKVCREKKQKGVVSFDNNSYRSGNSPPPTSALPQWELSNAVSRSPANRNCRPAPKTAADQSEPPLHVGTPSYIIQLTNRRRAKSPESIDLVELRGFWPIAASQKAAITEARGAGSAVSEGKSRMSIKVTWAQQEQGWRRARVGRGTHEDTQTTWPLTLTQKHK